jgi:hypothetical protein
MPTQLLPVGPPTVLTQNVTYALPAQLCVVTSSGAVETSLDGTTWTAFTSGGMSGAVFIRSGAANTIVTCK